VTVGGRRGKAEKQKKEKKRGFRIAKRQFRTTDHAKRNLSKGSVSRLPGERGCKRVAPEKGAGG